MAAIGIEIEAFGRAQEEDGLKELDSPKHRPFELLFSTNWLFLKYI